ncbi:PEP-CTERM sorting domain-containing protein [Pseudoduganella sp. LjRoot289]|uniref:PEP-CTERM sorting domain-containing protein n=1 Tax=Pseudoduganella sp. LjRoot289 TaxID=3342314 RepID=UPI003ECF4168
MPYLKYLPIALLAAAPLLAHSAPYYVKRIGVSAGGDSYASSINNAGAVVGVHHPGEEQQPAAFLAAGGTVSYPGNFFALRGINDNGVIAGNTWGGQPGAYTWQNGQMSKLADLGYGAEGGRINNAGQVAGIALTADGGYHAAVFSNGGVRDLGTLYGGNSDAAGINDNGVVVGSTDRAPGSWGGHAFIYENGVMSDIGTLPGDQDSSAWAINAGRAVVGTSSRAGGNQAFLYANGNMQNLGALTGSVNSYAQGINDAGQVVGWSFQPGGKSAFLYDNGSLTDLNTLIDPGTGWRVQQAFDINESGDIAAKACKFGVGCEIVVLSAVPEPGSYAMLLAGFGVLGFTARRQRRARS